MTEKQWMIYGAYGYTGQRIVREAVNRGLRPVLAGRNSEKIRSFAQRMNLACRCFDLSDPERTGPHLDQISLVLNCAGPFAATSVPLAKACMESGADYMDITGEIEVLETIHGLGEKAEERQVILCPGSGFDVIATDCMAAALKSSMPAAKYLTLAIRSKSSLSPGTAKTIVESFKHHGMIRQNGVIKEVPLFHKIRKIDFGSGPETAVAIPWGDVSTAYYTTGIPCIEVYAAFPERWTSLLKPARAFRSLLGRNLMQRFLKKIIEIQMKGPDRHQRAAASTRLWAESGDQTGRRFQAKLTTANGYDVTITGSLGIVLKLMTSKPKPGVYTPSQLMGTHYISQLPGCGPIRIFQT